MKLSVCSRSLRSPDALRRSAGVLGVSFLFFASLLAQGTSFTESCVPTSSVGLDTTQEVCDEPIYLGKAVGQTFFAPETVIDLAIRPVDRGGSAGELRIWILVEHRNFRRRIMELKQYAEPAIAIYQPQPPVEQWLKEVRSVFWPGLDGSEYNLVNFTGDGWFWVREKRVSLIDVPYASKKNNTIEFRDELARYDSNQLGLAHGRQAQASTYYRSIEANTEAFRETIKEAAKAYLKVARKAEARKSV